LSRRLHLPTRKGQNAGGSVCSHAALRPFTNRCAKEVVAFMVIGARVCKPAESVVGEKVVRPHRRSYARSALMLWRQPIKSPNRFSITSTERLL